jgi:Tfp pilus assembly protein PilX
MKRYSSDKSPRRGAALLLSVLVLFVIITLSIQIGIGTMTDARVARNDLGLAAMDDAIESALLEVAEQLKSDVAGGSEEEGAVPGSDPMGGGMDPTMAPGGGEGEGSSAVDSKEDEWARPQRTEINGMELRIFIQDEDSKYNVLNMLHESEDGSYDEEMSDESVACVARIIDLAREGTDWDIKLMDAESMAREMREHMLQIYSSGAEEAEFLSTIPDNDRRLPLTLREFLQVEGFAPHHFRDFRDRDGQVVHSLGSFLTVWSCLTDGAEGGAGGGGSSGGLGAIQDEVEGGGGAQGNASAKGASSVALGEGLESGVDGGVNPGGADTSSGAGGGGASLTSGFGVNINTAPAAVLKGLFDDREVSKSFWDDVIEYRNLKEEIESDEEEAEPVYDEYGNEVFQRQIFDTIEELEEVPSWGDLSSEGQELVRMYTTTTSSVFSVFVTARRSTSNREDIFIATSAAERDREEEMAAGLVKTVRAVVWRREGGESGADLIPILRWDVVNFSPYEIQDFPDEDR